MNQPKILIQKSGLRCYPDGMRRALTRITLALLAFASGLLANRAAYRAVDYFFPDASIPAIRMTESGCRAHWVKDGNGEWYLAVCQ